MAGDSIQIQACWRLKISCRDSVAREWIESNPANHSFGVIGVRISTEATMAAFCGLYGDRSYGVCPVSPALCHWLCRQFVVPKRSTRAWWPT